MSDGSMSGTDHEISVRSVQVWHGGFDSSFVDSDGNLQETAQDLQFHEEKSLSFKCSCGKSLQKWGTAANHLRSVDTGTNQGGQSDE